MKIVFERTLNPKDFFVNIVNIEENKRIQKIKRVYKRKEG